MSVEQLSYFNSRFIKTGALPKILGRAVNKAFDLRQRGSGVSIVIPANAGIQEVRAPGGFPRSRE